MTTRNGHHDKEPSETKTTDHFAAKAHETVDSLAERAQRAERGVRAAADRTVEQAEQSLKRATSYFESNPLAVVGVAFVAGVLLSAMMRR